MNTNMSLRRKTGKSKKSMSLDITIDHNSFHKVSGMSGGGIPGGQSIGPTKNNTQKPTSQTNPAVKKQVEVVQLPLIDMDFEKINAEAEIVLQNDKLNDVLKFPENDIEAAKVQKEHKTVRTPKVPTGPQIPEYVKESYAETINEHTMVKFNYSNFSLENNSTLLNDDVPGCKFEIDLETDKGDKRGENPFYECDSFDKSILKIGNFEAMEKSSAPRFDIFKIYNRLAEYKSDQSDKLNRIQTEETERRCGNFCMIPQNLSKVNRYMVDVLGLEFVNKHLNGLEPFFVSMTVHEVSKDRRSRMTETFCPDINSVEAMKMFGKHLPARIDESTKARRAIITVSPTQNAFLIVQVSRVLLGEINNDPYLEKDPQKYRGKHQQAIQNAIPRLGEFRQPFLWCFLSLKEMENGEIQLGPLFKQEATQTTDHKEMYKVILDKNPKKSMTFKKEKMYNGTLRVCVTKLEEFDTIPNQIDPMLCPLQPQGGYDTIVRCLQDFSNNIHVGEDNINCFYIHPQLLMYDNRGHGRNIVMKFEFLDNDDSNTTPIPGIHGKAHTSEIQEHAYTGVTYHNKHPSFLDEVKINLPLIMNRNHHIKISIYHIHIKPSKKMANNPLECIGYAVLPIMTSEGCLILDGIYNLPCAPDLPEGYIQHCSLDTDIPEGPMGPIKWFENKKPLLQLKFKVCSTLHPQDPILQRFLEESASMSSETKLVEVLFKLGKIKKTQILRFLTVIFRRLFLLLCDPKCNENTTRSVVMALGQIVSSISDTGSREKYLDKFVKYTFDNSSTSTKYVFMEMVEHLKNIFQEDQKTEAFSKHSWFFLEIIEKSALLYLSSAQKNKKPRQERFDSKFMESFNTLILLLSLKVRDVFKSATQYLLGQSLNRNLAFFLRNCLSYMDRTVIFNLIQSHMCSITMSDSIALVENKFIFMHIIMMYEHYLPMCVPVIPNVEPQKLTIDNPLFREKHGLVSLLMTEVTQQFLGKTDDNNREGEIRKQIILMVKHLLSKLMFDSRYDNSEMKHRIAVLHFPLVLFIIDNSRRLTLTRSKKEEDHRLPGDEGSRFNFVESRGLCLCFLSLFKALDPEYSIKWLANESGQRINNLVRVLKACVACFKYRGKRRLVSGTINEKGESQTLKKVDAQTAKQALAGQYENILSAKERLAQMREQRQQRNDMEAKNGTMSVNSETFNTLRRKTVATYMENMTDEGLELEINCQQTLSMEASLQVLSIYDLLCSKSCDSSTSNILCEFLVHLLEFNQCELVILKCISCIAVFVEKNPDVVFTGSTDLCAALCRQLLRYCNSEIIPVRTKACATIYILMRMNFDHNSTNFTRMSIQFAMAVSKIIGNVEENGSADLPRPFAHRAGVARFLINATEFCKEDTAAAPLFKQQFQSMIANLTRICEDTMSMLQNKNDPDMYCDMQYRIAQGYSNSPDLRLAWLQNIESFHQIHQNLAEVAMCKIHMCALVAEYLYTTNYSDALPPGSYSFYNCSPNATEESAISADIQDEEGMCCTSDFTEQGFSVLLESCASALAKADLLELVPAIAKLHIPILEKNRQHEWLKVIYQTLADTHQQIIQANITNKRLFGTYFRVKFAGQNFEGLDGKEFIYKEPKITPLATITLRLEKFYQDKFGTDLVEMYQEADEMDLTKLKKDKNYIQITHVEPYFDDIESRDRVGQFERSVHIKRFVFDTPYTLSGKARGELHEQCKKRTILETSHNFPYIKKRIDVIGHEIVDLEPIAVAIEEIQKKCNELKSVNTTKPVNIKLLQLVLQGAVSVSVNAGPIAIAECFLGENAKYNVQKQRKLKRIFKNFINLANTAVDLNSQHCAADQALYSEDLVQKNIKLGEELGKLIY